MNPFQSWTTSECRVGIVGQYNAGKTVLLTSLINHLQNHDSTRFRLGAPGTILRRWERVPADIGWTEFPFQGYRDALVHRGTWPEKTSDRSMFACRFQRSDWHIHDSLLKLYDLPGERIADSAMLGRTYAEWSDQLIEHFRNDTPYRECCEPFFQALANPESDETMLVQMYKLSLARLILSYKPLITPSTFLLDKNGSKARVGTPAEIAAARLCGLDAGNEFTPLPAEWRKGELGYNFEYRYRYYREQVAGHFLHGLRSCHALIVLVDVPMLLAGGVGMYDDNRQMIADLFQVLEPGESLLGTGVRHFSQLFLPTEIRPAWINRVAFVAPKLDLVHPDDRDKVLNLLKRMVGRHATDHDGLKVAFFNLAAVVSTKPIPGGERAISGVPMRDADGKKIPVGTECRFVPSAMPDDWPLNWDSGEYSFPEVYPQVPRRKDAPPEQINLDRLLDFVMN